MDEYDKTFFKYQRETWQKLSSSIALRSGELVTPQLLNQIKAFNDEISMDDVIKIYEPLVNYIILRKRQYDLDLVERQQFAQQSIKSIPFIVGIAGSVAVGKSTTARLLQYMLQVEYGDNQVALTTTDGFLFPNATLKQRNLMERKGFPESYNTAAIIEFLNTVKGGAEVLRVPIYSHELSDVVEAGYDEFQQPGILIVEGVNTLQFSEQFSVSLADFFDLSIFVDAPTPLIEKWYIDRFLALLTKTKQEQDLKNYFWQWTKLSQKSAIAIGHQIWQSVNVPNLEQYILPTRNRADLVLKKDKEHQIAEVWLRKF
ncbi:type I pantothenate kinase [Weissella coleopterorum]|uniref:Pantothenate kinase n=1 Tax=Weissella coleopterorum TaxID=2714949 RepID=A0A6G8AZI7_9LACO|nr:type I pantothenate kinase [Weissella coleopterorum]QIL50375.1 type I pantothenate kinase [Weissella coleopterorum]